MCGIGGFVDFSKRGPTRETLERMGETLAHRGPDASGITLEGPCGLVSRRLSVLDLQRSHQPMSVEGIPVVLAYNGELYDFRELRANLAQGGRPFTTSGDTEVVLRALDKWGTSAPGLFHGQFALAAWNWEKEELLLARDPLGIKPLFYSQPRPECLVFASEIKSLLRHPDLRRECNLDGVREVLRFRALSGDRTLYRGVRRLAPGCLLRFDRRGAHVVPYFDLGADVDAAAARLHGLEQEEIIRLGEGLLEQAVRRRLLADVPVGAFLSGGLDSSLIVALMGKCRPGVRTRTFSVGFHGDEHSDLEFAREASKALGTRHTQVLMSEGEFLAEFIERTIRQERPISEPAHVAIGKLSAVARESVKVVLTGEGSDELFCGYPKYRFAEAPWALRAGLRTLGVSNATRLASLLGLDPRSVRIVTRALTRPDELERVAQWFSYMDRDTLAGLLPGLGWTDPEWDSTVASRRSAYLRFKQHSGTRRMQAVDLCTWLHANLLDGVDRMSMSEGLEARVPFLDTGLIGYALALQRNLKIRSGKHKWIVRRWARAHLPSRIASRKHWGFRVPLAQWFRGGLRNALNDYLRARDGLCGTYGDRPAIDGLLESHDEARSDVSLALWTLFTAEVWYRSAFRSGSTVRTRHAEVSA